MKKPNKTIPVILLVAFLHGVFTPPHAGACYYRRPWHYGSQGTNRINVKAKPKAQPNTGERNQSAKMDPVYLHNGDFAYDKQVLFIPSRGLNTEIALRYNSQSLHNGRFGYGWDMNYNQRIIALSNGDVIYLDGQNRRYRFKYLDGTEYISPFQIYDTLTQNTDGTYTLTKKDKTKYNFDQNGCLVEIIDTALNKISLNYNNQGRLPLIGVSPFSDDPNPKVIAYDYLLTAITDSAGKVINLDYDASGRLNKITDFARRVLSCVYSETGDLISMTMPPTADYPDGTTTAYAYTNHNLETITDAKGQAFLTNHYDVNDRVDWQIYGTDKSLISYPTSYTTEVTDPKGNKTVYTFNENGNPVIKEERDAAGTVSYLTRYEYSSNMELAKIIYPKGNSVEYRYDSQAAVLKGWEFNSNGNAEGWDSSYNNISSVDISDGVVKIWISGDDPFAVGPPIDINANKNQQLQVRYKVNGGNIAQFYWEGSAGGFSEERHTDFNIIPDGEFHTYTINVGANSAWTGKITRIRADPNVNSPNTYAEIDYMRVVEEIPKNGNVLEIRRRKSGAGPDPQPGDIVTSFTYEPRFNKVKTIIDPRGNATTYTYDYELAQTDPNYGEKGNLVGIAYPSVEGQTIESAFTYNSYGQVLTISEANNNITKYEYYPDTGYLKKTISDFGGLNLTTEMGYDAVGNLVNAKDPNGNATAFEYDSHNNLIKVTSAAPFNYVTTYKYDANDMLVQVDRQTNNSQNPWQSVYYTYDILDRPETIRDELDNITTFAYDGNGNRASVKDAENNVTLYQYDARNLLWKVTDALGNVTEYAYDNNGNLRQIQDANRNATSYAYDDFDRLITTTYADNSLEEYTYDAASNLITKKDARGQTIYYEYDALNRLAEKGLSPKGAIPESIVAYAYDRGSRLIDVTAVNGVMHYSYDDINRLIQVIYPGNKSVSYEYDCNSNRVKLTYPDSSYIIYEYDQLNRLTAIKNQSGINISSYIYDELSRRTQLNLANNTQTIYEYDDINRLTRIKNLTPQGSIAEFNYTYDKTGNRRRMTTPAGDHIYAYDSTYQLRGIGYPDNYGFLDTVLNYDPVGNRTSTLNNKTMTYATNNLNQYTQVGPAVYTYDLSGNLTGDGTSTYTYDYENRLIHVSRGAAGDEAIYAYDPFGRRIKKEVTQNSQLTTQSYIYDGDQIIAEYDANGNLLKTHIYGPGIDEILTTQNSQPTTTYYHFDGLGSITNITNASGATIESYSYDVFGAPSTTSAISNRYMFTGREYDSETGLCYYRARYYDPRIGRFLQRDPIGYIAGVNLYRYVWNSPNNAVDPLGLYTLIIHGINPIGKHEPGYSGDVGQKLTSAGEATKEVIWSGNLRDMGAFKQIENEIKQAAEIAKARGEPLNIISHSWGNVLVGHSLNETGIKVDNWVKMGSPYFSTIRPSGTVRVANIIDPRDPVTWISFPSLSSNIYVSNEGESLFEIHDYWNNPDVAKIILRMFKLKKGNKK